MNNTTNVLLEKTASAVIDVIRITNLALSVCLNTLGLLLLKRLKVRRLTNQQLVLMSMSLADISLSVTDILYMVVKVYKQSEYTVDILTSCHRIIASLFFTYYGILFLLTLDRLLAFTLHLKYRRIVTAKRTLFCLLASWISGVIIAFTFFFGTQNMFNGVQYKYVYMSLDVIVLVEVIITYAYIIIITSKKKRIGSTNVVRARGKIFFVTTLIIATFILLVVMPDILNTFIFLVTEIDKETMANIVGLFWSVNFVVDPCLYIFFQHEVRNMLRRTITKRYSSTNGKDNCHVKSRSDAYRRTNSNNWSIRHIASLNDKTMDVTHKFCETKL